MLTGKWSKLLCIKPAEWNGDDFFSVEISNQCDFLYERFDASIFNAFFSFSFCRIHTSSFSISTGSINFNVYIKFIILFFFGCFLCVFSSWIFFSTLLMLAENKGATLTLTQSIVWIEWKNRRRKKNTILNDAIFCDDSLFCARFEYEFCCSFHVDR